MLFRTLIIALFSSVVASTSTSTSTSSSNGHDSICSIQGALKSTTCIHFSVGQGTGCQWMCQYCANQLGTNNYYFTDGVCTYQTGGCIGNPQVGVTYTCCAN